MSNNIENSKFTWNDLVIIKKDAPAYLHPGEVASVCGIEKVKFEDVAQEYHTKVGNWIYTVEFDDGSDITLPEMYLEKCSNKKNND